MKKRICVVLDGVDKPRVLSFNAMYLLRRKQLCLLSCRNQNNCYLLMPGYHPCVSEEIPVSVGGLQSLESQGAVIGLLFGGPIHYKWQRASPVEFEPLCLNKMFLMLCIVCFSEHFD